MPNRNTDDDLDIDNNEDADEEEEEVEDEDDSSDDDSDSDSDADDESDADDSDDDSDEDEDGEGDGDSDDDDETVPISKKELEQLRARAGQKSAKERIKSRKGKKDAPADGPSDATLARLEARGIMEPEDQRTVLNVMKRAGLSIHEAVNDPYVKSTLENNKKRRSVGSALPGKKSKTKAPASGKTVDHYIKRGLTPDPKKQPKLFAKYQERMAELSAKGA